MIFRVFNLALWKKHHVFLFPPLSVSIFSNGITIGVEDADLEKGKLLYR
jgi:hypothetical protein